MSRRFLLCLAGLMVAVPAWAASPDGSTPGGGAMSWGATSLSLRWNAPMGAGALIACRARVVPLGPGANARAAEVSVVVPGGGAQCALEIPLAWQGSMPPAAINVFYELDVQSPRGMVARTGMQTIVLPHAMGTRTRFAVPM